MSKPKSLRSKLNAWFARGGLRSAHRVCGRQGGSRRLLALALQMLVVVMLNAIGFAAPNPAYAQGTGPLIDCTTNSAIFNTGYNGAGGGLPAGSSDINWDVGVGDASGPGSVGGYINAWVPVPDPAWAISPFGNAKWISHTPNSQHAARIELYFRYNFTLAPSVLPGSFVMTIDFYADNSIWEVYINSSFR